MTEHIQHSQVSPIETDEARWLNGLEACGCFPDASEITVTIAGTDEAELELAFDYGWRIATQRGRDRRQRALRRYRATVEEKLRPVLVAAWLWVLLGLAAFWWGFVHFLFWLVGT